MDHSERVAVTQSAPSASCGAPRTVFYRGSRLGARECARIQRVAEGRPALMREAIARKVGRRLRGARPKGQVAVSSCRLLVRRLARQGFIRLPAARRPGNGAAPRRVARGPKAVFVSPLQRHARDRLRALARPHESRKPEGTPLVTLDIQTGSTPGTPSPMGERGIRAANFAGTLRGSVRSLTGPLPLATLRSVGRALSARVEECVRAQLKRDLTTPRFWAEEQQEGAGTFLEKRRPDFSRFPQP